jgi:hypothetical protein
MSAIPSGQDIKRPVRAMTTGNESKSDYVKKQDPFSICGIVIAAAWTPQGDVTEVDIAGNDEKRYRVIADDIGGQLRAHIKKCVVVEGVVRARKDGLAITVKRFRIDTTGPPKSTVSKPAVPPL